MARMTAPAALGLVTARFSRSSLQSSSVRDPVIASRSSLVTMLSFPKIGTPRRGLNVIGQLLVGEAAGWAERRVYPRRPELLSLSSKAVAIEMAAGFICRTACSYGFNPCVRVR